MAEINYICPQTNAPIPELDARNLVSEGKGYGVKIAGETGTIEFIAHPGICVSLVLYDRYMRNTWSIMWEVEDGSSGDLRLAIGTLTASCYADKIPDPQVTPRELWRTILFSCTNGTSYVARYVNTQNGFLETLERTIPCPRLRFPSFGDFRPYLMFDYSFFESIAQNLPLKIFPEGAPPRIPSVKVWTSILDSPLESKS